MAPNLKVNGFINLRVQVKEKFYFIVHKNIFDLLNNTSSLIYVVYIFTRLLWLLLSIYVLNCTVLPAKYAN